MNQMLKNICFFVLIFIFSFAGFAQDTIRGDVFPFDTFLFENVPTDTIIKAIEEPVEESQNQKPVESKIYYGGYVNLTFGSYTVIGIEPSLAYKFTPRLSVGTKLTYEYIHEKQGSYIYEESDYGFSLFTRLRLTQRFYTHVEYSSMNYNFHDDLGGSERKWVPFLFVGGGLSQPISKNTWLNAEVLFDVLQNENSPYNDWEPFYSVGFGVGF
jgi:hypothetical protein